MSIHTAGYTIEWYQSGVWTDISSHVISVEGDFSTVNAGNGIAFGDSSDAGATITVATASLDVSLWAYIPVRGTFVMDANTARGIAGVIISIDEDMDTAKLTVTGYKQLISTVRVYSDLWQYRPIATKTTATSVEDPSDGAWAAGALNWIMWQAGGRPYEQAGTYTSAAFYYSLSQAPIAPKFSWIAGEDGWEEALKLVRAAGGQLYQRPDGVIAYVSPLSIAGGTPQFSLTTSDFGDITRAGSAADVVNSYTTTYVPRILVGLIEVVSDSEPRIVAEGQTITIELEPQYPVASIETDSSGSQLLADAISAVSYDGTQITQGAGYTHTLDVKAQKITIGITNAGTIPFVIEKIVLRGTPIVPGEAGTVTVGSGTPTQSIEQNPYIQSRSHAQRLARMALAFYDEARPVVKASGVLYNPVAHQIGIAGTLTLAAWGLSSEPVVILGVSHSETGATVDLEMVVTDGLPALADYFLVSTSSQSGLTRFIGY